MRENGARRWTKTLRGKGRLNGGGCGDEGEGKCDSWWRTGLGRSRETGRKDRHRKREVGSRDSGWTPRCGRKGEGEGEGVGEGEGAAVDRDRGSDAGQGEETRDSRGVTGDNRAGDGNMRHWEEEESEDPEGTDGP